MGPAAISVLMLLAVAGFTLLAWRKLRIVAALQPEARFDRPLERLRSVVVNGFLQRRMVRREWRPGLMHAVLFLGFCSLLLRKLQLIAIGYRESAAFPDAFGGPFAAFKDAIEIAVVARRALRALAPLRRASGTPRAQPRGGGRARADPGDHGHRLRL